MWEMIKQEKAGLGVLSIRSCLSLVGPSWVFWGGLGPERGLCGATGCWVFNCVVQAVVGLRSWVQRVVLGAQQPGGGPVCSPPCQLQKAQTQAFMLF